MRQGDGETRSCCYGGGSGGGIRIDVRTLRGTGQISANGSNGTVFSASGGGGGGRVAIYYQDATGFDLNKITAFGGTGFGAPNGGAGTVYLQGPQRETGELVVDNNNLVAASLSTPIPTPASGSIVLTNLRVRRAARVRVDSFLSLPGTLEVSSSGEFISSNRTVAATIALTTSSLLTHFSTTATAFFKVDLSANTFTVDATSRIDVTGRGFLGGNKPGNPFDGSGMTFGFQQGSTVRSGGSYGGLGGLSSVPGASVNPVYGDLRDPNEPGSGGASGDTINLASNGGGLIRIVAQTLQLDGVIKADGEARPCCYGGASGGGIRIDVGTLRGTGQISANGSNGTVFSASGGGGGGRVAIYYQDAAGFDLNKITALGGTGFGAPNGQNGTVHLEQSLALWRPNGNEAPVMKAQVERPQRGIFEPVPATIDGKQQNLYLTMLASSSSLGNSLLPNPKSKIENPKSQDDFDPIYTYDLNGNRTSMIDPTGLTTYTYDALNRLTSVTNNRGITTTFTYDALGRRTSMTHGNKVVTTYSYDAASQLLSLVHQLGATNINSFSYSYDKVGNRKTKADRNGSASYTYDTLNRLVEAINPLPTNPLESFQYDAVGNRTTSNQNGASVFNQANQLEEDATFRYVYDANGNQIRKTNKTTGELTQFEYDAENKLVRVVRNGTTINYKYDGLGRRVEKEVNDGATTKTTRFVYDNEDILLELDGSNNITARYTHGPGIDEPLVMERGGSSFFYHADGLGSITEITDSTGVVKQQYAYSSFGKIESQLDPNFIQPYTFTAREFDPETGLHFYQARYYDPTAGRFLQEDPILRAGNPRVPYLLPSLLVYPQMLHPYVYVANRPTKFVDPSGEGPILLGACIAGTALDLISTIRTLDQLERELEEIKKQIRKIESCPDTSDVEKLEKIKELQEKGFKIARKKVVELGKGSAIAIVIVVVCTAAGAAGPL